MHDRILNEPAEPGRSRKRSAQTSPTALLLRRKEATWQRNRRRRLLLCSIRWMVACPANQKRSATLCATTCARRGFPRASLCLAASLSDGDVESMSGYLSLASRPDLKRLKRMVACHPVALAHPPPPPPLSTRPCPPLWTC